MLIAWGANVTARYDRGQYRPRTVVDELVLDRVTNSQAEMVAGVLDLLLRNGALSFRCNKEPLLEYVA